MKSLLQKQNIFTFAIFAVLLSQSVGIASAQFDTGWGNTTIDSGWGGTVIDTGWGNTTINSGSAGWGNTTIDSGWGNTTSNNSGWGNSTINTPTVYVDYGTTYTSPTYGYTNYGYTGNYGYTNYGYTNYGYTNYGGTGSVTCPSGTTYTNGSCVVNTTSCPSGTTYTNGSCVVNTTTCPTGSSLVNGACVVNTTTCPAGTTLINGTCVSNTTTCPAGSSLVNGICTVNTVVTYPTYGYTNYTNYTNYGYANYSYQTCWDGSVVPSNQACAQQYKTCSNGSVVLLTQTCYKTCPNGTILPDYSSCPYSYVQRPVAQVVKFNNVVTSPATQVTNTSARCNGVGLIANAAQSKGWFEYGETANLGRQTADASIGSANTAPFSNVLTNLKPETTYYCRAVMSNQYGTVKGTIVKFTTNAKAVTYIAPQKVTKVTTAKVQTKVPKKEVICSDGSTSVVANDSQLSILSSGQKLVTLQLDTVSGQIAPDADVNLKLDYKNVTSGTLHDVIVKVTLPEDFTFVSSNVGSYDADTRTITLNQNALDGYAENIIAFKVHVAKDALLGKSIVTTGYVSYTVLTQKNGTLQDEVTSYLVSSVAPNIDIKNLDTGAKKVIGTSTKSFLPSSLIEWLALIAIMFILFILGRSIYATYQEEEDKAHH